MIWRSFLVPCAALAAFGQAAPAPTAGSARVNLSALAAGVLEHARQARTSVSARDKAGALGHVEQALNMAREARSAAEASGMGANGKLVVPVYGEVETESVYRPVKGGKGGAMTASRMKKDTNVREVTRQATRISLDVNGAAEHLEAARTALNNGDFIAAGSALAAVEKGVITESANSNMPLLRARENLDLARSRMLEGKYKAARVPLQSAAKALAAYGGLNPGPHAEEASRMRAEMDAYARNITRDRGDALDRIGVWSDTVNRWYAEMTR